jgi:hypothetical protein
MAREMLEREEVTRRKITKAAREELEWFYGPMGGRVPEEGAGPPEARIAAVAIARWLGKVLTFHRGALALRYDRDKQWPTWLTDKYGDLTTLIVRLECTLHPSGGGKSNERLEEESVRRFEAAYMRRWRRLEEMADLEWRAKMHVRSAVRAYGRVRGDVPSVLPGAGPPSIRRMRLGAAARAGGAP